MDHKNDPLQPPRRPRHVTKLHVLIQRDGEPAIASFISDLSLDGCCVSGYFRPDEKLTVTINGVGRFEASVRWARFGSAGLQFMRTLPTLGDPL